MAPALVIVLTWRSENRVGSSSITAYRRFPRSLSTTRDARSSRIRSRPPGRTFTSCKGISSCLQSIELLPVEPGTQSAMCMTGRGRPDRSCLLDAYDPAKAYKALRTWSNPAGRRSVTSGQDLGGALPRRCGRNSSATCHPMPCLRSLLIEPETGHTSFNVLQPGRRGRLMVALADRGLRVGFLGTWARST